MDKGWISTLYLHFIKDNFWLDLYVNKEWIKCGYQHFIFTLSSKTLVIFWINCRQLEKTRYQADIVRAGIDMVWSSTR